MGKYDFIKTGNLLYWNDPDNGISSGVTKLFPFLKKCMRTASF